MQVPTETNVTVGPDTAQMLDVVEVKLTGRPEVEVAVRVGDVPNAALGSAPKEIVWLPCVTWKLWLTGVAAVHTFVGESVA